MAEITYLTFNLIIRISGWLMGSRLAALCLRTRFSSPNQQAHSYILPKFLDPTVRLRPRRPIRSPRCEQDKGQRPVAPLPASHFHAGPTDPRPAVGPTSAPSPPRVPLAPRRHVPRPPRGPHHPPRLPRRDEAGGGVSPPPPPWAAIKRPPPPHLHLRLRLRGFYLILFVFVCYFFSHFRAAD